VRVRGLALAVAALAALAARADAPATPAPPQPPPRAPPRGAERVEVHLRFEPWALNGRFRLVSASGAIADEGLVRDDAGLSIQRPVERVLEGSRGTLVLNLVGGPNAPSFPWVFGRWTVRRGTGAYVGLAGAGTFTTCAPGEAVKGSPFELQTLVGHLHPR
jgi:hypothetical protein